MGEVIESGERSWLSCWVGESVPLVGATVSSLSTWEGGGSVQAEDVLIEGGDAS
jgi:hypothetical protein